MTLNLRACATMRADASRTTRRRTMLMRATCCGTSTSCERTPRDGAPARLWLLRLPSTSRHPPARPSARRSRDPLAAAARCQRWGARAVRSTSAAERRWRRERPRSCVPGAWEAFKPGPLTGRWLTPGSEAVGRAPWTPSGHRRRRAEFSLSQPEDEHSRSGAVSPGMAWLRRFRRAGFLVPAAHLVA